MIFLRGALVCLLLAGMAAAVGLDEQEKLQIIQKELKQSQEKLSQTKQQQQEVLGKLVVITQELKQATQKLSRARGKVKENESKISALTIELRNTEDDLQEKSGLFERRVREAFKNGRVSYLDLLFASRSMSDFLNRFYYFEKIMTQDANLIRGVREDLQTTKVKRGELHSQTREIRELSAVIAEQKMKMAEQQTEKKKVYEELKGRRAEYENKIAELERSSRELEVLIQRKILEKARAKSLPLGTGALAWPLQGRLTSRFGIPGSTLRPLTAPRFTRPMPGK